MHKYADNSMTRAALYARISNDQTGAGLGVERQLVDCRAYSSARGWSVTVEYVDNDISAYSGKTRPGYQQLLRAVSNGEVDVVVAWHTDRLHRRLRELVEYTDALTKTDVLTYTVKAGEIDLSTPSGIMIAQIKGAVDEAYVSESRLKNLRAREAIAKKGGRHKSGRVYGWNDDGQTLRLDEAAVVNEVADRLIAGESQVAVATRLNSRGIPTSRGKRWTGIGIRKVALRPSNAAIRSHQGNEYPSNWEPIFTFDKLDQVRQAVKARDSIGYKRGTGRVHLLTGFAFCGNCGAKLGIGRGHSNGSAAYRCNRILTHDPMPNGCGKVNRNAAPVEHLISACVLERLDSDALLVTINQAHDDRHIMQALLAEQRAQRNKIDRLNDEYATTELRTPTEFARMKASANDHLSSLTKKVSALSYQHTLTNIDLTKNLTEVWATASLEWRRSVIELLVDKIYIDPSPKHAKRVYYESWHFDPALVRIIWRV
jgi:site-specific DNA recombinase